MVTRRAYSAINIEERTTMKYAISNSLCPAFYADTLQLIPKELGIEIFSEFGTEEHWKLILPGILHGRTGSFSVHGPHSGIDLADRNCDFETVLKSYIHSFITCGRYGGKHVVCHTHATRRALPAGYDAADGEKRAMERIYTLARNAEVFGVRLLVENLQYPAPLFAQKAYQDLFDQIPEVDSLVDVGHAFVARWDIPALIAHLGFRIKTYHIHDNNAQADQHRLPGEGLMDWKAFFTAFKNATPDAELVLEYLDKTLDEALGSIAFLEDAARQA